MNSQEVSKTAVDIEKLREELAENTRVEDNTKNVGSFFFGNPATSQIDFSKALTPDIIDETMGKNENHTLTSNMNSEQLVHSADEVLISLASVLGDVGQEALSHSEKNPTETQKYLQAAQAVNLLALALKETGKGSIQFRREIEQEDELRKDRPDDGVYIFSTGAVSLGDNNYENIRFFIRPKEYMERQARTRLEVISDDLGGSANIRIDPARDDQTKVTFDIYAGKRIRGIRDERQNIFDKLDRESGEKFGHHFPPKDIGFASLGVRPWQIHEAIAARLNALAK